MKKNLKIQTVITIIIFILLGLTTVTFATSAENLNETNDIVQTDFNINVKDSIKRSMYNQYLTVGASLESKYSLRDNLSNIFIKNQKQTNSCWAFAYANTIETTIAKKYNRQVQEYSAIHMDYMATANYNRNQGVGANTLMTLTYGASGWGPVYESDFPFEDVYSLNYTSTNYLKNINNVELNQEPRARIEDIIIFPKLYKYIDFDEISYSSGSTQYSIDEVEVIRQLIKNHIKENGAIRAVMYTNNGSYTNYYNSSTNSYYYSGTSTYGDHGVTIIGWDDNYSKDNFKSGNKPINDGAYICLNTWGTDFGDDGFFYISYDDVCIESELMGISNITEKENQEQIFYDKVYQYDELGVNYGIEPMDESGTEYLKSGYAANVFKREQTEKREYLSEVGVYLLKAQGVEVYVNPVDDNIDNCTLAGTYIGNNALETGYHTLELASPVELTGDKFVVKIKYINSEGISIPIECDKYKSGFSSGGTLYTPAVSNVGESFISLDGTTWNDLYGYEFNTYKFEESSACIKAFTTLSEGEPTVTATGVILDKETVTLKENETSSLVATVLPENATNKNITWISDNTSVATVSNGVITGVSEGTATITVKTEDGNFKDTCTVTVETKTVTVTGVNLDKEAVTIKEEETSNLLATVLPENATNKNITWVSDDENIATVSNGVITGVSKGTATITVKTEDGNFTDTCTVTVEPKTVSVTGVILEKEVVILKEKETSSLVATVLPENATNKNITWVSDDENIAIVSNGVITGVSEGTATITVKTEDGNFADTCTVTVEKLKPDIVSVTKITLNEESVKLKIGETSSLVATVLPENATNKNIIWTSDNENIATVVNGVVTGVSKGTATITVKTEDGNFGDTCTVIVEPNIVTVTKIELNEENMTLKVGETSRLLAKVLPENATNKNITWTSDNKSVVTVSNGVITGVSEGTATITVKTVDGNFTDTCTVTVEPVIVSVTKVTLNEEKIKLKIGETVSLVATVLPKNATNKNIIWTSSDKSVATVINGVITGVSEGTTTITVKTEDGKFVDTCTVTIQKNNIVEITEIELDKITLKLQVGDKVNLVATIKPINATNKEVIWKSSNVNIATISENGIIEALKPGTTIITVTTKDGKYTASCELIVDKKTNYHDDIYTENEQLPGSIEEVGDSTIIEGKIPNAGTRIIMKLVFMLTIATIIIYKKYKKLQNIR